MSIVYDGKEQSIGVWAKELGISKDTLKARFKRGWSIQAAFTTPVKNTHKPLSTQKRLEKEGQPLIALKEAVIVPPKQEEKVQKIPTLPLQTAINDCTKEPEVSQKNTEPVVGPAICARTNDHPGPRSMKCFGLEVKITVDEFGVGNCNINCPQRSSQTEMDPSCKALGPNFIVPKLGYPCPIWIRYLISRGGSE